MFYDSGGKHEEFHLCYAGAETKPLPSDTDSTLYIKRTGMHNCALSYFLQRYHNALKYNKVFNTNFTIIFQL